MTNGFERGAIGSLDEFVSLIPHLDKKENRLYAAKKSFAHFMLIYMSHHLTIAPAQFQLEQYKLAKEKRLLLMTPRGYGKSVIWSTAYPLWVLLNNPFDLDLKWNKEELICLSATADFAERWIRSHKRELEANPRIINDYAPEKGEIWRSNQIELKGRGSITAVGAGAQIRGIHPTELIIDDLEDRAESKSEPVREEMREYFYKDLWGTVRNEKGKETRVKIIGTPVHPLALLPELYMKDWWEKRCYPIMDGGGNPLWPEYENKDALMTKRLHMGEMAWWSECMLAPKVAENPVFERDSFQFYEPGFLRSSDGGKIGLKDMYIVTCIDPAISQKDSGDYTAIVTYGATWDEKDPRIFCLDARRGHWLIGRQISEMMALLERFPGSAQLIETVAYQNALYHEYKRRLDMERLDVKVIAITPDKDKGRRAHVVQPLFQRRQVFFDNTDPNQRILMDELTLFDYEKRKTGRDDLVDASVYALTHIQDWMRRRKKKVGDHKELNLCWTPTNPIYVGARNGR